MRKALVRRGGQIIEVDVDDNQTSQLHKAQWGEQVYNPIYDEYGDEYMSSKHRTRNGKDFQRYVKYNPDNGREYIEKQWFDPNANEIRTTARNRGSLFRNQDITREAYAPNPYIPVERRSLRNDEPFFPWKSRYQMGGAPQEGQGQGPSQEQVIQLIQAYAEAKGISPEEIMQQLQQMNPQEQKQAIDQMAQELQGGQEQQQGPPQQEMAPEQMMQRGGPAYDYVRSMQPITYGVDPRQVSQHLDWGQMDPMYGERSIALDPRNNYANAPRPEIVVKAPKEKFVGEHSISFDGKMTDTANLPSSDEERLSEAQLQRQRMAALNLGYNTTAGRNGTFGLNAGLQYNSVPQEGGRPVSATVGGKYAYTNDNGASIGADVNYNINSKDATVNVKGNIPLGKRNKKAYGGEMDYVKFALGGDSQGQLPVDLSKPESKLKSFVELAQNFGQMNHDKAFEKDIFSELKKKDQFQVGGYIKNPDGSETYDLGNGYNKRNAERAGNLQNSATNFANKGDTFGAFANLAQSAANTVGKVASKAIDVAKVAAPIAANIVAPGSGILVKAGMNALDKPKGGAGAGAVDSPLGGMGNILGGAGGGAGAAEGAAGAAAGGGGAAAGALAGGFDPSALLSLVAKYGGNIPKFQSDILSGQFSSGIGSFGNSPAWNFGTQNMQSIQMPAPVTNFSMANPALNTPDKNPIKFNPAKGLDKNDPNYDPFTGGDDVVQPGNTTDATDPNKKVTTEPSSNPASDPASNPTDSKNQSSGFAKAAQASQGVGSAISGFIGAMGNKGKGQKAQNQADMALLSDNMFDANYGNRKGYNMNAQDIKGNYGSDSNVPMGPNASEFGKYGMQLAKAGTQVQNPYLSNPNSHPEAILYGEPDQKISNTLKPVKREHANLEAEVGEVAVTPGGADGVPKFFKIGGKNHYDGGTPLSLPENTFIFSKTRSMIIKDPKILKELTGSTKPASPADLAKKFDYSQYVAVLQNENSDPVERKTAQFMIENMMYKLGQIAIIQEAKKGFPSGIPLVAVPYLEKAGIDPQMLLPQSQQEPQQEDPRMQQEMDPAMQEQMMQEQMGQPEQMEQPMMQRGGGYNMWSGIYNQDGTPAYTPNPNAKPMTLSPGMQQLQDRFDAAKAARNGAPLHGDRPKLSPEQTRRALRDVFMGQRVGADGRPVYHNPYATHFSEGGAYDYEYAFGGEDKVPSQAGYSSWEDMKTKMNAAYAAKHAAKPKLTYEQQKAQDARIMDQIGKIFVQPINTVNPAFNASLRNTNAVNYKPNSNYIPPFKIGGTNIMGGPILPIYQDAGTFTSSASTPEEPNFAQKVLGPLFNYIPEEEVVDIPVSTSKTFEVSSPQKGFKDYSELDKFITDSKELTGTDVTPLYDAYSGALTGITALKKALINGDVPMDVYQKEKEALTNRIDNIKTEISTINQSIPNYKSTSYNPWSTANKLQDLEDILDEEKKSLNIKAVNLNKFKVLQNNYSELINEKIKLNEAISNPSIDGLEKMKLSRRLIDLNDAIYNENINVKAFGNDFIRNDYTTASNNPNADSYSAILSGSSETDPAAMDKSLSKPDRIKFGYNDYRKAHGSNAFAFSKLGEGQSNSTPTNMVPANNVASDSIAKSVPVVDVKTAPKKVSRSSSNNSSTFDDNDTKSGIREVNINDFIIVDSKK